MVPCQSKGSYFETQRTPGRSAPGTAYKGTSFRVRSGSAGLQLFFKRVVVPLGSYYRLGTPIHTHKSEDSASNEPLGSPGDCNRTRFRAGRPLRLGGSAFSICEELLIASSNPRRAVNNPPRRKWKEFFQKFKFPAPGKGPGADFDPIFNQFGTNVWPN